MSHALGSPSHTVLVTPFVAVTKSFILAHIIGNSLSWHEECKAAGHTTPTVREQRDARVGARLTFFHQPGRGLMMLTFRTGLPISTS